jgi:WD40 repeat protein
MVMQMGMVDRGAQLDWLSQYPEEKEILLPPLTGMEVQADEVTADDVRRLTMRLNINLRTTTLEELLAARQKELTELVHMAEKDLRDRRPEGDIPRRLAAVHMLEREIHEAEQATFNENGRFVEATEAVLSQLPRIGDELQLLSVHSGPVFALAAPKRRLVVSGSGAAFLTSGSWDGSTVAFGKPVSSGDQWAAAQHGSPVLAVAALEPGGQTAVGCFDGTIGLFGPSGNGQQLVGHGGAVTALAWLAKKWWLASGSVDTGIIIWDLSARHAGGEATEAPRHWRLPGHADTVRALCWIEGPPDEQEPLLASGSLDGTAMIWRPVDGAEADAVAVLDGHDGPVTAVVAGSDADGEPWLATASADRSIVIWELKTMRPVIKTPWCHRLGVCALVWLPEQRWLASGSADTTVKLWQLPADGSQGLQPVFKDPARPQQGQLILRGHTDTVHALATIPSRGWLVSGSSDSSIRIWRVGMGRGLDTDQGVDVRPRIVREGSGVTSI